MNVFEAARGATARQIADYYGLRVNRHGMMCCLFHDDRTPSMKVDRRYYCFGCGEKGDGIDLTAQYFGVGKRDAAIKICDDFGFEYENNSRKAHREWKPKRPKKTPEQEFKEKLDYSFRVLSDYLHLLKDWKIKYAPKDMDAQWHPFFCEALENITRVEHMLDTLLEGDVSDRAFFITDYGRRIPEIEQRVRELIAGSEDGGADSYVGNGSPGNTGGCD